MSKRKPARPVEPLRSRTKARQTQEQAAELMRVALRTWEDWEGGRRNMPEQMLQLYRHLAGVERIPYRDAEYDRPED